MGSKVDICAYAYMEYYRSNFAKYRWSSEYGEGLIRSAPVDGLIYIAEILKFCRNHEEIAFIATGLLEDLLFQHLHVLQPTLKDMVRRDKIMKAALRYVWAPEDTALNDVLRRLNIKTLLITESKGLNLRVLHHKQDEVRVIDPS